MWRTFRKQALTGAAQPIFGDKLTAAMAIPPSHVDPIINVADTTIYQQGDRITLDAGQANADTVLITTIKSGTQMQVTSQGAPYHAHAANAIIALALPATEILISGNAGTLYLGTDNTITAVGGGNVMYVILPGAGFRDTYSANWNTVRTDDLWMAGAGISDSAIVAAQVI
jgi:hypothetical protein